MQSLVSAYLAANLNSRGIPLKEFMDSFEKQILLACLRLTQGHQRNAAGHSRHQVHGVVRKNAQALHQRPAVETGAETDRGGSSPGGDVRPPRRPAGRMAQNAAVFPWKIEFFAA